MKRPYKCTKRRFRDEIAAKMALANIARIDDSKRASDEKRHYFHRDCQAWHLTSQEYRPCVSR